MNLTQLLAQQDLVLTLSFSILVLMSVLSWSIIIIQLLRQFYVKRRNQQTLAQFWQSGSLAEMMETNQHDRSAIAIVLKEVWQSYLTYQQKYYPTLGGLKNQLTAKDYFTLIIRNATSKVLRRFDQGLVALASIGSVAPFIGLFGTVWGIFNALMDISQQGQVSIATVSAPIGEALIATALGLFVAIPAVLAYNAITRLNRTLSQDLDAFAHDLYIQLLNLSGEK